MNTISLTSGQKKAIDLLGKMPLRDRFYWTGGTLLSFHYLHHRKSEDIDFFSDKPFLFDEVNYFSQRLKKEGKFRSVTFEKVFDRFEFFFANGESLRVEFVHYNGEKKTLGKRGTLLGVNIDSLEDIAANKTLAYFDRNEPKDLFDIYFLIKKRGFTPQQLLSLAHQKAGVAFSESLFWSEAFKSISQLNELTPLLLESTESKKKSLLSDIETYFKDESSRFLRKQLG